jgi:glycosyltransferase involved in cell wall biosynthesis
MAKWNLIIYAPAYNVERSISGLVLRISEIAKELEKSGVLLRLVTIVNDGSTDSTRAILAGLKGRFQFLEVINKDKNIGPAKAILDGVKASLEEIDRTCLPPAETIIVRMDSDLEHQPEDIANLIKPILSGASSISVGYVKYNGRNGLLTGWFNRFFGLMESRRFLGMAIPQFCPGFNAVRADLLMKIYPVLEVKANRFEKMYHREMLTIDFVTLVIAKKLGGVISAVELRPIEDKWIKKPPVGKLINYASYHNKTEEFLKKELQGRP